MKTKQRGPHKPGAPKMILSRETLRHLAHADLGRAAGQHPTNTCVTCTCGTCTGGTGPTCSGWPPCTC